MVPGMTTCRALFILTGALALFPLTASADAGAHLAGRAASQANDFEAAARYLERAASSRSTAPGVRERALVAQLGLGQIEGAYFHARAIEGTAPLATLTLAVQAMAADNWAEAERLITAGPTTGTVIDPLIRAWAKGDPLNSDLPRGIALLHGAFAAAIAGDNATAKQLVATAKTEGLPLTARAQSFAAALDAQGPIQPATPAAAVAIAMTSIAAALADQDQTLTALIYARLAHALDPNATTTQVLTGELLTILGRPLLAAQTLARVPATAPERVRAERLRADALDDAGNRDAALATLAALAADHPANPDILAAHAALLQRAERHGEAIKTYDAALDATPDSAANRWMLHYFRGISHFHADSWPQAERDFRAALAQRPNQPQVLNYLGYSLVERGEKLDEALDMIERAVRAAPDSGAITDSLAWALFRLGRYQEAIGPMERAVELEPADPIVSDHLGDVLWAVSRRDEAVFQWKRALSFSPDPPLAARIRRKLDVGLDAVLADEGAAPIH